MDKLRILIIDDEHYSRKELIHILSGFDTVEIVGEAESGEQAIIQAVRLKPNVVFLDIEMPGMNGFETAKALQELKQIPKIVFATAYPQFGVEAFRYEAIDYLLKPFDEERIAETVTRLEKVNKPLQRLEDTKERGRLAIEIAGEIIYIDPHDIIYLACEEKILKIVTTGEEYEVKLTLKELESRLQSYPFFRIHKSYLVHLHYIKKLSPWFNGAYQLELTGRKELLSVSRNYAKTLRSRLEL